MVLSQTKHLSNLLHVFEEGWKGRKYWQKISKIKWFNVILFHIKNINISDLFDPSSGLKFDRVMVIIYFIFICIFFSILPLIDVIFMLKTDNILLAV